MERHLVFIPLAAAELPVITGELQLLDRPAHRVTPELMTELGYAEGAEEEAEYAALVLASVAALARYGERLVLVAEVPVSFIGQGDDPANGGCVVSTVDPAALTCWFSEAPGVDIADAAAAAKGLDIDTAWDFDEVQSLLEVGDLLWNDVEEYRRSSRR